MYIIYIYIWLDLGHTISLETICMSVSVDMIHSGNGHLGSRPIVVYALIHSRIDGNIRNYAHARLWDWREDGIGRRGGETQWFQHGSVAGSGHGWCWRGSCSPRSRPDRSRTTWEVVEAWCSGELEEEHFDRGAQRRVHYEAAQRVWLQEVNAYHRGDSGCLSWRRK